MKKKSFLTAIPAMMMPSTFITAYGNPQIDLLAVTTVVGNQTLEKVTRNALAVARIAGITGILCGGLPAPADPRD